MPTSETGRPRPRTRNAGATRAVLVGASVSHFTEEGFARTSVDRVVAGLDLTKGAAYHHFKDKTQLFEAAFEFVQARFSEQLGAAVSGLVDPDTILATSLDQYLTACRDPSFLRIAVLEAPAALGWERWKEMEAPHLLGVLRAALAKRSGDPGAASSAGLCRGLQRNDRRRPGAEHREPGPGGLGAPPPGRSDPGHGTGAGPVTGR